jgi:hypothetical protein
MEYRPPKKMKGREFDYIYRCPHPHPPVHYLMRYATYAQLNIVLARSVTVGGQGVQREVGREDEDWKRGPRQAQRTAYPNLLPIFYPSFILLIPLPLPISGTNTNGIGTVSYKSHMTCVLKDAPYVRDIRSPLSPTISTTYQ